ncbi:hypothetical protein AAG570_008577 [Ranatra chinensis]|uniref:Uncharacterized protein n=1 Tax=Ranatra chinensis TaxID=642074 RepID=A0ABD0YTH1_9HEMI
MIRGRNGGYMGIRVADMRDDIINKMNACKKSGKVTDDEFEEFMKPLVPKNNDEKCLMACVMKEYKIIENGAYNPTIAALMSEEIFKNDPVMAGKAKEVSNKCNDESK